MCLALSIHLYPSRFSVSQKNTEKFELGYSRVHKISEVNFLLDTRGFVKSCCNVVASILSSLSVLVLCSLRRFSKFSSPHWLL